jgi:hypothetical protein
MVFPFASVDWDSVTFCEPTSTILVPLTPVEPAVFPRFETPPENRLCVCTDWAAAAMVIVCAFVPTVTFAPPLNTTVPVL